MGRPKKLVECTLSAQEFATLLGVNVKTAREYCLKIQAGDHLLKKLLAQENGLVSVTRLPQKWRIVVRQLPPKK